MDAAADALDGRQPPPPSEPAVSTGPSGLPLGLGLTEEQIRAGFALFFHNRIVCRPPAAGRATQRPAALLGR